jgi:alpha-ketoglutarate-dependent taurine dioxygenase
MTGTPRTPGDVHEAPAHSTALKAARLSTLGSLPGAARVASEVRAPGGGEIKTALVGRQLSAAGGVEVGGVDLSQTMSPDTTAQIRAAFLEHHIVVFHDQNLTREQQFAFACNFGEVERHGLRQSIHKRYSVAHVISNLDGDGNPVDRSASAVSNYHWHTDKPYYVAPPMMTTLYAVELPPDGGDTEFANTAMAYSALSEAVKREIAGLRVLFRWGADFRSAQAPPTAQDQFRDPVAHPLVRTHPETGQKALYLGNHASCILGLPRSASGALLEQLLVHATQPQFVYKHRWRIGDLVMWDNRCLLHRAVANFEITRYRRILHRTVVRGTIPF